ncbi:unnamed protein product, partial [Closterium sp. Naga37s-1]
MDFACRGVSPRLLVSLLLLSLSVLRIHARHRGGPEISVADAQSGRLTRDAANSHRQFDSQSHEVGTSEWRQDVPYASSASSGSGGGPVSTMGAGSDGEESIAEWKWRSAEGGVHFFPLQRAEDAPSRDELHRRILAPRGVGGGLRAKGEGGGSSDSAGYYLPLMDYNSTLVSTANGTMGNTMVNYSTFAGGNDKIRLPYVATSCRRAVMSEATCSYETSQSFAFYTCIHLPYAPMPVYPYYVTLKLGSQKQEFSMALNLFLPHTFVPCDCLHCGSMRKVTTYSKPFSTLSSSTLEYISCTDHRCQKGVESGYYGCNTQGLPNYLNFTGVLPGDDALCVCGVNQMGHWGMQGWQYGSWSAGGVLGLGWSSPFLEQLTSAYTPSSFAVCLEEPTPTNKTGWDGQVPLQTGRSHLVIGAFGLTKGAANYTYMDFLAGMQYSHITLTTAKRALNITDDPAYVDPGSYLPADFPKNATPGFLFMPESFVHLLRYPLFLSLCDGIRDMTGHDLCRETKTVNYLGIPCFKFHLPSTACWSTLLILEATTTASLE